MPSIERTVPDTNELDPKATSNPAFTAIGAEVDDWTAPAVTKKISKKTKKGKKNAATAKPKSEDGDDSPAQLYSLASSPANDPVSKLRELVFTGRSAAHEGLSNEMMREEGENLHDVKGETFEEPLATHVIHPLIEPENLLLDDIPLVSDDYHMRTLETQTVRHSQCARVEPSGKEFLFDQIAPSKSGAPRPISIPTSILGTAPSSASNFHSRSPSFGANLLPPRPFQKNTFTPVSPPPHHQRKDPYQAASTKPPLIEAPLPHKSQPHFFSVPDLGFNMIGKQEQGKTAGSDGCCCHFDSFAEAGDPAVAKRARDVLLVGSEGGLDVYRVSSDKLEVIGRLEGLRGAVMAAKILPRRRAQNTHESLGLLVAIIIHGPASKRHLSEDAGQVDHSQLPLYQTTVEIYSVTRHQYVTTLYEGVPGPKRSSVGSPTSAINSTREDFQVDARGNFITLASGRSGEIWIFTNFEQAETSHDFRCLGKFWTALQNSQDTSAQPHPADQKVVTSEMGIRQPLYTLGERWLAIVPPYTSGGVALRGHPSLSRTDIPLPGIHTQLAPVQPPISCEVAGIDAEGTLSWLSRKAAQGLVKASQRGYEIGVQGWKELTNPASPAAQNGVALNSGDIFPPTNAPAEDPKRLSKEPALVSVIDLHHLALGWERGSSPTQGFLATFALVEGCNHLSFSTDGTKLLTVNRKGEASTIWDLQCIAHGKKKFDADGDSAFEKGPHVRQVHRIIRTSPSTVIGSEWSRDSDRIALLTTHGTIHLHEIPLRAVDRRRRRRSTVTAAKFEKAEPTTGVSHGMSPPSSSSFWNTVRSGMQSVGAQVHAIRTHSSSLPTTFAGFREVTTAAGQAGGRAVAKGFSQGYSVAKGGASDMWHAEDNKIRQKALQHVLDGQAVLRWMHRNGESFLAVVCGGAVHLYPVQQEMRRKGSIDVTSLRKFAPRMFTLPRIAVQEDVNGCSRQGPHGFWTLHEIDSKKIRVRDPVNAQPTDVESNPPYCPFHVDPRISIFAFDDGPNASQIYKGMDLPWQLKGHGTVDETAWTFGEPLPPSLRINEHTHRDHDEIEQAFDVDLVDGMSAQVESKLTIRSRTDSSGGDQQIRLNTRRTRKRKENGDNTGFGIVEDETD